MRWTEADLAYLRANPHKWPKFQERFGELPADFSKPTPRPMDLDYLQKNPQMADKFVAAFGELPEGFVVPEPEPEPEPEVDDPTPVPPPERDPVQDRIAATAADAYGQETPEGIQRNRGAEFMDRRTTGGGWGERNMWEKDPPRLTTLTEEQETFPEPPIREDGLPFWEGLGKDAKSFFSSAGTEVKRIIAEGRENEFPPLMTTAQLEEIGKARDTAKYGASPEVTVDDETGAKSLTMGRGLPGRGVPAGTAEEGEEQDSWLDVLVGSTWDSAQPLAKMFVTGYEAQYEADKRKNVFSWIDQLRAQADVEGVDLVNSKTIETISLIRGMTPEEVLEDLAENAVAAIESEEGKIAEMERWMEELRKVTPKTREGSMKYYAGAITQAGMVMLPATFTGVLAGMVGGPPAGIGAVLAVMSTQVYNQRYGQARADGRTHGQASADAAYSTFAELVGESSPTGIILGKGGKTLLKKILFAGASGGMEEIVTETLESLYEVGVLDDDMTFGEAMTRLRHAGIIGAGMGVQMSVLMHPLVRNMDPKLLPPEMREFTSAIADHIALMDRAADPTQKVTRAEIDASRNRFLEAQKIAKYARENSDFAERLGQAYRELDTAEKAIAREEKIKGLRDPSHLKAAQQKVQTLRAGINTMKAEALGREAPAAEEAAAETPAETPAAADPAQMPSIDGETAFSLGQLVTAGANAALPDGKAKKLIDLGLVKETAAGGLMLLPEGRRALADWKEKRHENVINIGLDIGKQVDALSPDTVKAELANIGAGVVADERQRSSTENTMVVTLDRALTPAELNNLSITLQQEAIGARFGDAGLLEGPQAANWGGAFSPTEFREPTTPRPQAAAPVAKAPAKAPKPEKKPPPIKVNVDEALAKAIVEAKAKKPNPILEPEKVTILNKDPVATAEDVATLQAEFEKDPDAFDLRTAELKAVSAQAEVSNPAALQAIEVALDVRERVKAEQEAVGRAEQENAAYAKREARKAKAEAQKNRELDEMIRQQKDAKADEAIALAEFLNKQELEESSPNAIASALKDAFASLEKREQAAKARIKAQMDKPVQGTLFDLGGALAQGSKLYADLVEVGALKVAKGLVRFADWSAEMVGEFGKRVTPHLQQLYSASLGAAKDAVVISHRKFKSGPNKGQIVAAPPGAKTAKQVTRLRNEILKKLALEGEPGRFWYERSGKAVLDSFGGDVQQARLFVGLLALYSAGSTVGANTTAALKVWNQWQAGEDIRGATGIQNKKALEWLESGIEPPGLKVSNFYNNLMREVDPANYDVGQGATIDLWMQRAFGFLRDSPTDLQYVFAQTEVKKLAKALGWEPQQAQAAIWVAIKARWEMIREAGRREAISKGYAELVPGGKNGGMILQAKGNTKEAAANQKKINALFRKLALRVADSEAKLAVQSTKADYLDELAKHAAIVSWGSTPSSKVGKTMLGASFAEKLEFQAEIERIMINPDTGREWLAEWLGVIGNESFSGIGAWDMNIGATQQNVLLAPAAPPESGQRPDVDPGAKRMLSAYSSMIGWLLKLDAVSWHRPLFTANKRDSNGIDADLGRQLTASEVELMYGAIYQRMRDTFGLSHEQALEYAPVPTPYGFRVMNFSDDAVSGRKAVPNYNAKKADADFHDAINEAINEVFPLDGVKVEYFRAMGELAQNDWASQTNGESYASRISQAKNPKVWEAFERAKRELAPRIEEARARLEERILARERTGSREVDAPVSLDRIFAGGADAVAETYGRFGQLTGADTNAQQKIYDLTALIENPELVQAVADAYGYRIEYFSFESNPEQGVEFRLPQLKKKGYKEGYVWIYDPRNSHGSFKGAVEYTRAWRVSHEIAHGITERFMQAKYGDSKRYGRLGRELEVDRGAEGKQVKVTERALTLREAQRAVEWEEVTFRAQRIILEQMGVKVTNTQFAHENNINLADAFYRVMTGDFGNPGDFGFLPADKPADIGKVLVALESAEQQLAADQGRAPTPGVNQMLPGVEGMHRFLRDGEGPLAKRWARTTDAEIADAVARARQDGMGQSSAGIEAKLDAPRVTLAQSGMAIPRKPANTIRFRNFRPTEALANGIRKLKVKPDTMKMKGEIAMLDEFIVDVPIAQMYNATKDVKALRNARSGSISVYRGAGISELRGTKFPVAKEGETINWTGEQDVLFFTDSKTGAATYGNVKEHSINLTNPMIIDAKGKSWADVVATQYISEAVNKGHDGIVVKNVIDVASGRGQPATTYLVFNRESVDRSGNRTRTQAQFESAVQDAGFAGFYQTDKAGKPKGSVSLFEISLARGMQAAINRVALDRAAPPKTAAPKLRVDNPGGEWLAGKVKQAAEAGADSRGMPARFGTSTATLSGPVLIPIDVAAAIPGMMNEQQRVRQGNLDWLTNYMSETGQLPMMSNGRTEYAPFIQVDANGNAWVNEGNHRIMAAKALGWTHIPVEVRWFNGGEAVDGKFSPTKLLAGHAEMAPKARLPATATRVNKVLKRWMSTLKSVVTADRGAELVMIPGRDGVVNLATVRPARMISVQSLQNAMQAADRDNVTLTLSPASFGKRFAAEVVRSREWSILESAGFRLDRDANILVRNAGQGAMFSVARGTNHGKGISLQAASDIAQRLRSQFPRTWTSADIIAVESWEKLPAEIRAGTPDGFSKAGQVEAVFYDPGPMERPQIIIIANNNESRGSAITAVIHEIVGHYGVRGVLGAGYQNYMDSVWKGFEKEARAAATRNGIVDIDHKNDLKRQDARNKAAEEFIAYLAGEIVSGNKPPPAQIGFWEGLVRAFRQALARFGLVDVDARDIVHLIKSAENYARGGVFSRREARRRDIMLSQGVPEFYSQMIKYIEEKLPGSATAEQYLEQLKAAQRKGEFKKEEFETASVEVILGAYIRIEDLPVETWHRDDLKFVRDKMERLLDQGLIGRPEMDSFLATGMLDPATARTIAREPIKLTKAALLHIVNKHAANVKWELVMSRDPFTAIKQKSLTLDGDPLLNGPVSIVRSFNATGDRSTLNEQMRNITQSTRRGIEPTSRAPKFSNPQPVALHDLMNGTVHPDSLPLVNESMRVAVDAAEVFWRVVEKRHKEIPLTQVAQALGFDADPEANSQLRAAIDDFSENGSGLFYPTAEEAGVPEMYAPLFNAIREEFISSDATAAMIERAEYIESMRRRNANNIPSEKAIRDFVFGRFLSNHERTPRFVTSALINLSIKGHPALTSIDGFQSDVDGNMMLATRAQVGDSHVEIVNSPTATNPDQNWRGDLNYNLWTLQARNKSTGETGGAHYVQRDELVDDIASLYDWGDFIDPTSRARVSTTWSNYTLSEGLNAYQEWLLIDENPAGRQYKRGHWQKNNAAHLRSGFIIDESSGKLAPIALEIQSDTGQAWQKQNNEKGGSTSVLADLLTDASKLIERASQLGASSIANIYPAHVDALPNAFRKGVIIEEALIAMFADGNIAADIGPRGLSPIVELIRNIDSHAAGTGSVVGSQMANPAGSISGGVRRAFGDKLSVGVGRIAASLAATHQTYESFLKPYMNDLYNSIGAGQPDNTTLSAIAASQRMTIRTAMEAIEEVMARYDGRPGDSSVSIGKVKKPADQSEARPGRATAFAAGITEALSLDSGKEAANLAIKDISTLIAASVKLVRIINTASISKLNSSGGFKSAQADTKDAVEGGLALLGKIHDLMDGIQVTVSDYSSEIAPDKDGQYARAKKKHRENMFNMATYLSQSSLRLHEAKMKLRDAVDYLGGTKSMISKAPSHAETMSHQLAAIKKLVKQAVEHDMDYVFFATAEHSMMVAASTGTVVRSDDVNIAKVHFPYDGWTDLMADFYLGEHGVLSSPGANALSARDYDMAFGLARKLDSYFEEGMNDPEFFQTERERLAAQGMTKEDFIPWLLEQGTVKNKMESKVAKKVLSLPRGDYAVVVHSVGARDATGMNINDVYAFFPLTADGKISNKVQDEVIGQLGFEGLSIVRSSLEALDPDGPRIIRAERGSSAPSMDFRVNWANSSMGLFQNLSLNDADSAFSTARGLRYTYNVILPNTLKAFAKKYGSKVTLRAASPVIGPPGADINEFDSAEYEAALRSWQYDGMMVQRQGMREIGGGYSVEALEPPKLMALKVTEKMKAEIRTTGFPMFSVGKAKEHRGWEYWVSPDTGTYIGAKFNSRGEQVADSVKSESRAGIIDKIDAVEDAPAGTRADRATGETMSSIRTGQTGNAEFDSFAAKVGPFGPVKTLKDVWKSFTNRLKDRAIVQTLDVFHGQKIAEEALGLDVDQMGYVSMRLAAGADAVVRSALEYGVPIWKEGATSIDESAGGFLDILAPLAGSADKLRAWELWMISRRAERLTGEGREKLFSMAEIQEVQAEITRRGWDAEFTDIATKYADWKSKLLDFAQEAGVVNATTRPLWEHADHIPFYRVLEGDITGPFSGGAIADVKQQIQRLRGSDKAIGDPLQNIFMNMASLIDASMRNHAARLSITNLDGSGLVTKHPQFQITQAAVPLDQLRARLRSVGVASSTLDAAGLRGIESLTAIEAPTGTNVVSYMEGGKRFYYEVHDPLILTALKGVHPNPWTKMMSLLRMPKRIFTQSITLDPVFMARNWFRDMFHAFALGRDGAIPVVPGYDSVRGAIASLSKDKKMIEMMSGGGAFDSGYVNANDPAGMAKIIRGRLSAAGFVTNMVTGKVKTTFEFYRDLSSSIENSHRVMVFEKARKAGKTMKASAYEARDLMDFSMRGAHPIIRFIAETTPFWNARVQGLYRTFRVAGPGAAGQAATLAVAGMLARGALLTLASVALFFRNKDDERWKELNDFEKNTYYHFFDVFEPGDHYALPKPFEIGSLFSTIPEIIAEGMLSAEPDGGKAAAKQFFHMMAETLSLSPDVQAVMPIAELAMNRDTFRDSPILTDYDKQLLPEDQDHYRMSPAIRSVAHAMPAGAPDALRSPKQLSHLVMGYTGTLGSYAVGVADMLWWRLNEEEAGLPPEKRPDEIVGLRSVVRNQPRKYPRELSTLYDVLEDADRVYNSMRRAEKEEIFDRADALEEGNIELILAREVMDEARKEIRDINKEIREIHLDKIMSPAEKRKQIDELLLERNEIAKDVYDWRPGGGANTRETDRFKKTLEGDDFRGMTKGEQVDKLKELGMGWTADLISVASLSPREVSEIAGLNDG